MGSEGIPFSELLSEVVDNRGRTCPTADDGIPLIATNCIRNELLYPTYENVRFVSRDIYSTWFRGHPKAGDILFVNKATPGRVCLVPNPVDFCIAQDMVAVRADPKKVYPKYLFAALRSPIVQEQIAQMHVGSLIPHFKKGDFNKLLIPIPSPDTQEYVGDTYFDLSAKIDLVRRMNATLDAIARTLFNSWFVYFDPVRAKCERRDPGLPKSIADLFPNRFVDSEFGKIPAGWEVKKIGDLLELAYGKALKADVRRDGDVPVYGSNGQVGWHDECMAVGPGIVVGRKGNPGVVTWAPTDFFAIDTAFYVAPRESCRSLHFLFHVLQSHDLASLGADSAVPGLNRNLAYMSTQVLPPRPLIDMFDLYASSLSARVHHCNEESRVLATLRDTLLPELISGKLTVPSNNRNFARAIAS